MLHCRIQSKAHPSLHSLCFEIHEHHSSFVNVNPRYLSYEVTNKVC